MALQPNLAWSPTSDSNLNQPTSTSTLLQTSAPGNGIASPEAQGEAPTPFNLLVSASATAPRSDDPLLFYSGAASLPLTLMSFPPPPTFLVPTTQSNIPHGLSHTQVAGPGHASFHAHQHQYHFFHPNHHHHHHHHTHQDSSPYFHSVLCPFVQTTTPSHSSFAVQVAAPPPSFTHAVPPTCHFIPTPTSPSTTGQQQPVVKTESVTVPPSRTGHRVNSGPRQLMITFLDPEVTNAELHAAFAVLGPVDTARVVYDKASGKSKCFGFVYYRLAKDAATAMQCMSGHPIRGKRINVTYASPQRPTPPTDM